MFFETQHSIKDMEFSMSGGKGITFPKHMHRSFECFLQLEGSTEITVDDVKYTLRTGEAILIFPFQAHSYEKMENGAYEITIFAPEIVPEFHKRTSGLLPKSNRFLSKGADRSCIDNTFLEKAYCYKICGEFERGREYMQVKDKISDDITKRLLIFAEERYKNECSLREAAAYVGYDYAYLSKLFKRQTGIPFKKYVNMIRITKSKRLLASTHESIIEIGAACGFSCQRTFYREFKELVGATPAEYRKSATLGLK